MDDIQHLVGNIQRVVDDSKNNVTVLVSSQERQELYRLNDWRPTATGARKRDRSSPCCRD